MSTANPDEFTTITYETDGAVATITLDRPEQANAQSMRAACPGQAHAIALH